MRVGRSPPVWQTGGGQRKLESRSSKRRKLKAATTTGESRKLGTSRAEGSAPGVSRQLVAGLAGGGTPTQVGRLAAGRTEVRSKRRKSDACHRSSRRTEHRSEPESWPPVEPEVEQLTQVGGSKPAQPEDGVASESWGPAAGGAGGRNTGCTTDSSRLKRQGLRSLAFSIYGHFSLLTTKGCLIYSLPRAVPEFTCPL
jgi:hypothetical protein